MKMGMEQAYASSGKVFQEVSKRYAPGLLESINAIEQNEIIVVRGQHDHVEKLLDTLKIDYSLINVSQIPQTNTGRVMFVNCSSYFAATLDGKIKDSTRAFVEDGGRLITTDWSLGFAQGVFPGRLEKTNQTPQDVVEVQANSDTGRKLIGLNYAQCHPKWWLEGGSHIYDISEGVEALITSTEMEKKYGQPYVVAGWKEGDGEVLHFISHLELQRTKLKTAEDKAGISTFLKNMKVEGMDVDDAKVAELEAAYSTLNTVAHLCMQQPVLEISMKSKLLASSLYAPKSKGLL